jgi:hypothetical protein
MRKLIVLSTLILAFCIYACDKVSNPYISKGTTTAIPTVPPTRVDSTTSTDDALKKILVEDFTAHHCPNCPAASVQCEALANAHPTQVVFMEENVSDLAQGYIAGYFGSGVLDSAYFIHYVALADSEWNNTFIDGNAGMPGTMVNRLYYNGIAGGGDDLYGSVNVATPGDSIIGSSGPQLANIHIVDSMYAPPTSALSMSITTKLTAPAAGYKYYLVVGLLQDSIFDWQDSISNNVQYYLKRMTFRTAINDGGHGNGDSLTHTTAPQVMHYAYANTQLFRYDNSKIKAPPLVPPQYWNMAHMYIVAFVYQTGPTHNFMVLQAQQLHI